MDDCAANFIFFLSAAEKAPILSRSSNASRYSLRHLPGSEDSGVSRYDLANIFQ